MMETDWGWGELLSVWDAAVACFKILEFYDGYCNTDTFHLD